MDPPSQNEQTEAMQHSTDEVEETMSRSMKVDSTLDRHYHLHR